MLNRIKYYLDTKNKLILFKVLKSLSMNNIVCLYIIYISTTKKETQNLY